MTNEQRPPQTIADVLGLGPDREVLQARRRIARAKALLWELAVVVAFAASTLGLTALAREVL